MGQYRIVIEGTGCHHGTEGRHVPVNSTVPAGRIVDADKAARELVAHLQQNGHSIAAARIELTDASRNLPYSAENLADGSRIVGGKYEPGPQPGAPAAPVIPAPGQPLPTIG